MSSYIDEDELDIRIRRGATPRRAPERPLHSIYPARHIRRASTLPVRFNDDVEVEGDTSDDQRREPRDFSDEYREGATSSVPIEIQQRDAERERLRSPVIISNLRARSRSPSPIIERVIRRERIIRSRSPSPSRTRERSRSHGYYDDEFDQEDQETEKSEYSFSLSRRSKSLFSRDSTLGSISDTSESGWFIPESPAPLGTAQGKTLHVSRSRYTGDGSIGGVQSADLKVLDDTNQVSRKVSQSVFRWVYELILT